MADDPIVTISHLSGMGMCARGVRAWFSANGLDYRRFLTEGLPASEIEAVGDALCLRVVAVAREEAANGEH